MDVCESTAGRYRGGRFVEAFPGAVTRPVEDGTRISRALTAWDIQAHRTLASEGWLANMRHIAGTQAVLARAGGVLVEAQLTGEFDSSDRLTPAITAAACAWSDLASRWGDLTPPNARLDPHLTRESTEMRAAYCQLTGDAGVRASLDVIAARPGLERGTRATLHALESGSELAFVVAEKARPPRSDRTRPGALSPRAQRHRRWPGRPPG
jgi:hypothetical protein